MNHELILWNLFLFLNSFPKRWDMHSCLIADVSQMTLKGWSPLLHDWWVPFKSGSYLLIPKGYQETYYWDMKQTMVHSMHIWNR